MISASRELDRRPVPGGLYAYPNGGHLLWIWAHDGHRVWATYACPVYEGGLAPSWIVTTVDLLSEHWRRIA